MNYIDPLQYPYLEALQTYARQQKKEVIAAIILPDEITDYIPDEREIVQAVMKCFQDTGIADTAECIPERTLGYIGDIILSLYPKIEFDLYNKVACICYKLLQVIGNRVMRVKSKTDKESISILNNINALDFVDKGKVFGRIA